MSDVVQTNERMDELREEEDCLLATLGAGRKLVWLDLKPEPLTKGEREKFEARLHAVRHEMELGERERACERAREGWRRSR